MFGEVPLWPPTHRLTVIELARSQLNGEGTQSGGFRGRTEKHFLLICLYGGGGGRGRGGGVRRWLEWRVRLQFLQQSRQRDFCLQGRGQVTEEGTGGGIGGGGEGGENADPGGQGGHQTTVLVLEDLGDAALVGDLLHVVLQSEKAERKNIPGVGNRF